jgi:hypothetical protein
MASHYCIDGQPEVTDKPPMMRQNKSTKPPAEFPPRNPFEDRKKIERHHAQWWDREQSSRQDETVSVDGIELFVPRSVFSPTSALLRARSHWEICRRLKTASQSSGIGNPHLGFVRTRPFHSPHPGERGIKLPLFSGNDLRRTMVFVQDSAQVIACPFTLLEKGLSAAKPLVNCQSNNLADYQIQSNQDSAPD